MFEIAQKEITSRFIRFCFVGFSGLLVDFGFTYLFQEIAKVHKYVSNAIGFTLASTSNYYLTRIWTFHSRDPQIALEYSKFILVSIVGLGIHPLILSILVSMCKQRFYFSKLIAIIIVTIWNFLANLLFTFNGPLTA